jgi:hypothetical protein
MAIVVKTTGYILPLGLEREFRAWCGAVGDDPQTALADIVQQFLDEQVAVAEELFPEAMAGAGS